MPQTANEYLENLQPEAELERMYRTGAIFNASEDKIIAFLGQLGTKGVENDRIRHAWIIRGITANAILMRRYMEAMERSNRVYTWLVILLAGIQVLSCFRHW